MAAKKQTYEQAMKRLEEIVTRIDSNELDIDSLGESLRRRRNSLSSVVRSFIRLTEKSRKYWKRKINDKQFFLFGWNLQI